MNTKKTKNADIKYAKKDVLSDDDFLEENIRQRISIVIPQKVILELKKMAKKKNIGYQTLINEILFDFVTGTESLEKRVERLERKILKGA